MRDILYQLCKLPDLKITANAQGTFETIEAGGFVYNAACLCLEEALPAALVFLTRAIAQKEMKELIHRTLNGS